MSLDKAILDTLKGNFVPRSTKEKRKEHCNNCDENKNGFCGQCSCLIAWKTAMPDEICPLCKWGKYTK